MAATPEQWLNVVARHGLLPHVRDLPATPSDELSTQLQRHGRRCLTLTRELLVLLDVFDRDGIPTMPFKGPVLAVQLYGDPAARGYRDLDLLVREEHAERALAVLIASGYHPPAELRRFPFSWWRRFNDQCSLTRDGIPVELHWGLGRPAFLLLDRDVAWSGAEPVTVGGRTVRTLGREQLAIYLARHSAQDAWRRVAWIVDFAQLLVAFPELDWSRIADRARASGAERAVLLALRLTRDLLGVAPPPALAAKVEGDRHVAALAHRVRAALQGVRPIHARSVGAHAFRLRVQQRWRDRVRYLVDLGFNARPGDWAVVQLPDWLYWLYPFVRVFRLMAKYARRSA